MGIGACWHTGIWCVGVGCMLACWHRCMGVGVCSIGVLGAHCVSICWQKEDAHMRSPKHCIIGCIGQDSIYDTHQEYCPKGQQQ